LAIEAFGRTLQLNPNNADAHYLLGNAYGSSGLLEKALEKYRNALAVQPHHSKSEEFLVKTQVLIQSREHYRKAARLFDDGKLKDPVKDDLRWLDEAFRELIDSVALFSQSPAGHEFEACIKLILDRGSEQWIEASLSDKDRFWVEHCERGRMFLTARLWPGAFQSFSEAIQFDPHHAFIHHALGISQSQMGDVEGAMKSWLSVLEIEPGFDFARIGRLRIPKQFLPKTQ
jgi:tetratricopeptide (TPR) repeat protein